MYMGKVEGHSIMPVKMQSAHDNIFNVGIHRGVSIFSWLSGIHYLRSLNGTIVQPHRVCLIAVPLEMEWKGLFKWIQSHT